MRRASIDLGTNTCLLLIAECEGAAVKRAVADYATVVRLGQGVDKNREIHPDAARRTLACLEGYAARVREAGVDPAQVIAVATSQARDSRNGAEFFAEVQARTGFRFRTLSGDEEAKYTFLGGLLPGMDPARSVVIDIGGGSTEYMSSNGGRSLDLGSVRFTERYLKSDPVTDDEFWACQEAIDTELAAMRAWRGSLSGQPQLVGVAGTATTLAAWHLEMREWNAARVDEVTLTRGDVHRMVEELKWRTVAERAALPGVEKGREDVLLAGALILWRSMERLGFPDARVSSRGLRYGVLSLQA
jgi:exopolyphosphatase/guanosine-5'-triphosphate,3'-diphosphate pyrophosphatase